MTRSAFALVLGGVGGKHSIEKRAFFHAKPGSAVLFLPTCEMLRWEPIPDFSLLSF